MDTKKQRIAKPSSQSDEEAKVLLSKLLQAEKIPEQAHLDNARTNQTEVLSQAGESQFTFALFQVDFLEKLMARADAKAQFILGANAVLITIVVTLFSDIRHIFLSISLVLLLTYATVLTLFSLSASISIIQAFLVVYPRDPRISKSDTQKLTATLMYWRKIILAYKYPDNYNQALLNSSHREFIISAGTHVRGVSRVAVKKFDLLHNSVIFLIAGSVFWVLTLVSTLLFMLI